MPHILHILRSIHPEIYFCLNTERTLHDVKYEYNLRNQVSVH